MNSGKFQLLYRPLKKWMMPDESLPKLKTYQEATVHTKYGTAYRREQQEWDDFQYFRANQRKQLSDDVDHMTKM